MSGSGFAGELARLGQNKGCDVSAEDFDSDAFHAMLDGELSPMELDLVGGGTTSSYLGGGLPKPTG